MPPFNLKVLERFSSWMLASKWHRQSLIGYQYALNDYFERNGAGRPWLRGSDAGGRLFKQEMDAYADRRRKYDLLDGREVAEGGAARFEEESIYDLLRTAAALARRVTKPGKKVVRGVLEDKEALVVKFKRTMRVLTMYGYVLRSSSSKIGLKEMEFTDGGALRLKIGFWKRSGARGIWCETITKTMPAPKGRGTHPRGEYLRLMRIVIKLGGFTDMDEEVLEQHKVITGTLEEVFGGERNMLNSVKEGRKPTSHSMRKTGASAAYAAGVDKPTLQKWGEWSRGSGKNPDFWGALQNYVDLEYQSTRFSKQFFDWLMV